MTQNIEKVLQRGEKLDDLIDKTTDLEASVSDSEVHFFHSLLASLQQCPLVDWLDSVWR